MSGFQVVGTVWEDQVQELKVKVIYVMRKEGERVDQFNVSSSVVDGGRKEVKENGREEEEGGGREEEEGGGREEGGGGEEGRQSKLWKKFKKSSEINEAFSKFKENEKEKEKEIDKDVEVNVEVVKKKSEKEKRMDEAREKEKDRYRKYAEKRKRTDDFLDDIMIKGKGKLEESMVERYKEIVNDEKTTPTLQKAPKTKLRKVVETYSGKQVLPKI